MEESRREVRRREEKGGLGEEWERSRRKKKRGQVDCEKREVKGMSGGGRRGEGRSRGEKRGRGIKESRVSRDGR